MSTDIMKQLQEPFPPEDIEWRVGSTNADKTKGIALAYVTNRAIMNRLDDIFGPFGWRNEFREWKGNSQLCGISVLWHGEWITKWDGADDSQTEAVKGGLSDAMKRAGYQWGIGRYLYNLETQWVEIVPAGRSYRLKEEPELPEWALPEGYQYESKKTKPVKENKKSNSREKDDSQLLSSMKQKWQILAGGLDGFEKWVDDMKHKGATLQQMHESLAKKLLDKKKESA